MDKRAMIAEIAARHGVRLDPDDPAFLLVELNQMAFEGKEAELKNLTDEAQKRVIELLGALQAAGDIYKQKLVDYAKASALDIQAEMVKDSNTRKAQLDSAIGEAVKGASRSFESTVQTEISRLRSRQPSFANLLLGWLFCGLIGGTVAILGNYVVYGKDPAEAVALGNATASAWSKLDKKAQAAINAEREGTKQ